MKGVEKTVNRRYLMSVVFRFSLIIHETFDHIIIGQRSQYKREIHTCIDCICAHAKIESGLF